MPLWITVTADGHDQRSDAAHVRPYLGTPNAERYVIAADNLRRRQLRSALLHGSSRTWREQRRIWPGVAAGVVVVAVIVASISAVGAFRNERKLQRQQQQQQQLQQPEARDLSAAAERRIERPQHVTAAPRADMTPDHAHVAAAEGHTTATGVSGSA